jgi:uncharacterized protein YicC (UPF0701 family)
LLHSMTGQGAARVHRDGITVGVEVRTVNSRYYKLSLRTSEGYASLEPRIDEFVRRSIRRGTVQLDVRVDCDRSPDQYRVNTTVLEAYARQVQDIAARLKLTEPIRLDALVMLPGVTEEHVAEGCDLEDCWPAVEGALGESLAKLARNRMLVEFNVTVEATDVIREVGLFSERSDISEEVVRLRSHLDQFLAILDLPEVEGRKLEFVTQEMFREANTIGSKANDAEISRRVIDIKTAVERIREMIQNVE